MAQRQSDGPTDQTDGALADGQTEEEQTMGRKNTNANTTGTQETPKTETTTKGKAKPTPKTDAEILAEMEAKAQARAAKEAKAKEAKQRECLCGCHGMTKGGRFLPGHDAKWLSARVAAIKAAASAPATEQAA